MTNTKKLFLNFFSVVALIALILFVKRNYDFSHNFGYPPHLMINDVVYWNSNYKTTDPFRLDNCSEIGTVQEEVLLAQENGQANGISVGTIIYADPDIPWLVFTNTSSYAAQDADRKLVFFDGDIYIALDHTYDKTQQSSYYEDLRALVGNETTVLPTGAVLLGATHYENRGQAPQTELGSNWLEQPCRVYQNFSETSVLYVFEEEDTAVVYARLKE